MTSTEEMGWDGALAFKGEWGLGRQSQEAVARQPPAILALFIPGLGLHFQGQALHFLSPVLTLL